jgi:hypothetical protein
MMTINTTFGPQAGFGMPVSVRVRDLVSTPTTVAVSAIAAGPKSAFVDATPVCGYRQITDGTVLAGNFPGTSAWSPPI